MSLNNPVRSFCTLVLCAALLPSLAAQPRHGDAITSQPPTLSRPPARQAEITSGTVGNVLFTSGSLLTDDASLTPTSVREVPEIDVMTSATAEKRARLTAAVTADNFRENPGARSRAYKDFQLVPRAVLDPVLTHTLEAGRPIVIADANTTVTGAQPAGSLSGKIMYVSAGHGWTNDDTSTTLWYTQRPVTHGVVEDFGNLDQMNLFARMAFRAGATVVPMRPLGFQHVERVVDNDSPQAQFLGHWRDSESTVSFSFKNATVPYRFAIAGLQEDAVARFQPHFLRPDYFPVYCWARHGADRVNQLYRIVHAGGVHEVKVNHRRVGNGWVYLGEYYFNAGNEGYVEITNLVTDPLEADGKHVVVADAIRFGNGMGDVNRGGGVSDHPREEEASRYWIERALADGVEPIYYAFEGPDQRTNVGAAPRYAAQMNRESEGGFFDRLFLSFHSNAVGGRGVMGLFNRHVFMRPDRQVELAEIIARVTNEEMTSRGLLLPVAWEVRQKITGSHINFGEIRRDAINNEMSATINEVAFHDNELDAFFLRSPAMREAFARASLRASLRYFETFTSAPQPQILPPPAPRILSAWRDQTTNSIHVTWVPEDRLEAPTELTGYRVSRSRDGRSFDGGRLTTNALLMRFDDVTTGAHYFRITAFNRGGESEPSATLGVGVFGDRPMALVIGGFLGSSMDDPLSQTAAANLGAPLRPGGEFVRIVPRFLQEREQMGAIGQALSASTVGFDSVAGDVLSSVSLDLSRYSAVIINFGGYSALADPLGETALHAIQQYLSRGGALLMTGAVYPAAFADETTRSTPRLNAFATQVAGYAMAGMSTGPVELQGAAETVFSTYTLSLQSVQERTFVPRNYHGIEPQEGAEDLAYFNDEEATVAGVFKAATAGQGPIVTLGVPFEQITPEVDRERFMFDLLPFINIAPGAPEPVAGAVRRVPARAGAVKRSARPRSSKATSASKTRR